MMGLPHALSPAANRIADLSAFRWRPAGATRRRTPFDVREASDLLDYRFVQRFAIELLDETFLNGLENATDRGVHEFNQVPSEKQVIRVVTPEQ